MEQTLTIRDLYQQIGNYFREKGADRIVLLSSRPLKRDGAPGEKEMELQLAVDREIREADVRQEMEERWPQLKIHLLEYGAETTEEQVREIEEDGIKL